ncbi:NHL domain-containing protein [Larkinella arboricola]|uniref:NHL domain-containing protein n=1 Tax=Larkinella arboricola TaxID=643671 RepID=UPI000DBACD4A|nr:T9SS type A sorting domain-containing protein [Larkinella arboricola]
MAQIITTVAGSVPDWNENNPAYLNDPAGMAIDGQGNLFIADASNYRIRKVSPSGVITTVAGTGSRGFSGDGGIATQASLNQLGGLAVDAQGNLFLVANNRIRKVSPNGIITTIAGGGQGADGGPAIQASLNDPYGIALDAQGNLFIADQFNERIRKVSPNGIITTVAGTGSRGYSGDGGVATQAKLGFPTTVAVDKQGNLYIAELTNNRIRKVSPNGIITTVAGNGIEGASGDGGLATQARISRPVGVAVDGQGNLFISDYGNIRIRKVAPNGNITTVAGTGDYGFSGDGGPATQARMHTPWDVAVDSQGNLFIADTENNNVRKMATNGIITTVAGFSRNSDFGDGGPALKASLNFPHSVAVDGQGNLFIADESNHRIRKVTPNGIITTVAGNGVRGFSGDGGVAISARLNFPTGIEVDSQGNLYIADKGNHRIRKVTPNGIITTVAGTGTAGFSGESKLATSAELNNPDDLTVDGKGNLYIVDQNNNRIRKVNSNGIITTVAGTGTAGFSGDGGLAIQAQLFEPEAVAVDAAGNLFIADAINFRIRKVSTSGIITTVAGGGQGEDGSLATQASLYIPTDVALDAAGNLFIAQSDIHTIRVVAPDGILRTVAGIEHGEDFRGDGGPAIYARLNFPEGIALDGKGNLYIADEANHRIRKVTAVTAPVGMLSFSLMNADTDQEIKVLVAGETLNLATLPTGNLNIRANTRPPVAGSVLMQISGPQNRKVIESEAPYALFGDEQGNYKPWTPSVGRYSLTATPYTGKAGTGTIGAPLNLSFTVIDQPMILSFSLINADTDQPIQELATYGDAVFLNELSTRNLNIRVNTSRTGVGSVVLQLSGKQNRKVTETEAPYALFGDKNGNYNAWTPALGNYSLTATPYEGAAGTGRMGTPLTVLFEVVDPTLGARLPAGDESLEAEIPVNAYPNPFRDSFILKLGKKAPGPVRVRLYDGAGRKVYEQNEAESQQQIWPGSSLAPGMYLLQVGEGASIQRRKLLKVP